LLPKWRVFGRYSQLKRAALIIIAHQIGDSEELEDLRDLFLSLDIRGDGYLTKPSLVIGLTTLWETKRLNDHSIPTGQEKASSLEPRDSEESISRYDFHDLDEIFIGVDTDGSGRIEYSEFIAATMHTGIYSGPSPACKAAFRVFDRNADGLISAAELTMSLGWDINRSLPDDAITEQVAQVIREIDGDGDGNVNFEDFVSMLSRPGHGTEFEMCLHDTQLCG